MAKRVLIVPLSNAPSGREMSYYCTKDSNEKALYCDVVFPSEASCKYMLSTCQINEIIVFGPSACCRPGEGEPAAVRLVGDAVCPDPENASAYGLLRSRLMQFYEDIAPEDAPRNDLLSAQEQEEARDFLLRFFNERVKLDETKKPNRFFHYLFQDPDLSREFDSALPGWLSGRETDAERYRAWCLRYLYQEMKASFKMEPLECNESVHIRFLSWEDGDTIGFLNQQIPVYSEIQQDEGAQEEIELYLTVPNDTGSDIFMLVNACNLTKIIPDAHVHIARIIAESQKDCLPFRELLDKTDEFNVTELLSGTGAFLSYGKTDLMVEYWERANLNNPKIDRIIYAMRNIEYGISLCDIADIERGIRSLRSVINNDLPIGGDTYIERYFEILMESIQKDYGPLLTKDQFTFIDLVKWAYRKGFWQQTLTLIESQAPGDYVSRGIFYYSDGERTRKRAIEIFGQEYYDLKMGEKYKMDDVSHYYIKYYGRNRTPRSNDNTAYQMNYTECRMEELDAKDEKIIHALTICPDRAALKDLLFAYYNVGNVRNVINHAMDEYSGFYEIMDDRDFGERIKLITQAVDYFIHCYDRVAELIKGKKANVVTVRTAEIVDYSKVIRDSSRRHYFQNHGTGNAQTEGNT